MSGSFAGLGLAVCVAGWVFLATGHTGWAIVFGCFAFVVLCLGIWDMS